MNGKTIDGNFYMIDNLFGLIRTCTSLTVTQNEELRFQRVFTSRKYIYVCVRLNRRWRRRLWLTLHKYSHFFYWNHNRPCNQHSHYNQKAYSHRPKREAKAKRLKKKTINIKETFHFCFHFRLVWTGLVGCALWLQFEKSPSRLTKWQLDERVTRRGISIDRLPSTSILGLLLLINETWPKFTHQN